MGRSTDDIKEPSKQQDTKQTLEVKLKRRQQQQQSYVDAAATAIAPCPKP